MCQASRTDRAATGMGSRPGGLPPHAKSYIEKGRVSSIHHLLRLEPQHGVLFAQIDQWSMLGNVACVGTRRRAQRRHPEPGLERQSHKGRSVGSIATKQLHAAANEARPSHSRSALRLDHLQFWQCRQHGSQSQELAPWTWKLGSTTTPTLKHPKGSTIINTPFPKRPSCR